MIVVAGREGFVVTDKSNYREFHVGVGSLSHPEFVAAVEASDVVKPHSLPRHLWVSIDFLHRELGTTDSLKALADLEDMLSFASSKGWVDDEGKYVAAHVVVPE
ncbi:hypothetical protein [Streptomyces sp. NPDC029554]|uniref:hypothetical protein n=1 Tax=Streptomyces sp. NPDC029554 TaxID=3155126 RepID=UPI0034070B7C